jgi:hypothetical protein
MNFVNLTPHSIVLSLPDGSEINIPSSGEVARVATLPAAPRQVEGVPIPVVPSPAYGDVTGLPAPVEGVAFLVSGLVLSRCGGRGDVFAPATGPADGAIRDERGQIRAVSRLVAAPLA